MPNTKARAYLISVSHKREPVQVYAVLVGTPDEALEAVALHVPAKAALTVVGGLSRDLVKRLQLEPREMRLM